MYKFVSKVAALLLCVSFLFGSQPHLTSAQVATFPFCVDLTSNIGFGARDTSFTSPIMLLQNFLKSQGYLNYEATGYYGALTQNAVSQFQAAQGIEATGFVGKITRDRIKALTCASQASNQPSASAPAVSSPLQFTVCVNLESNLSLGASDTSFTSPILLLQSFLKNKGYLNSSATGYYGQLTKNAVMLFQQAEGIQVTGVTGVATRARIKALTCTRNVATSLNPINLTVFPINKTNWKIGERQKITWTEQGIGSKFVSIYIKEKSSGNTCFITSVPASDYEYKTEFKTLTFQQNSSLCNLIIQKDAVYTILINYTANNFFTESESGEITAQEGNDILEILSPTSGIYNVKSAVELSFKNHIPEEIYDAYLMNEFGVPLYWFTLTGKFTEVQREIVETPTFAPPGKYRVRLVQTTQTIREGRKDPVQIQCALRNCAFVDASGEIFIYVIPGPTPVKIDFETVSSKEGEIIFEYSLRGAQGDLPVKYWEVITSCPEGIRSHDWGEDEFKCNETYEIQVEDREDGWRPHNLPGRLTSILEEDTPVLMTATAHFENDTQIDDFIEPGKVLGGDGESLEVPGVPGVKVLTPNGGEFLSNVPGKVVTKIKWQTVDDGDENKISVYLTDVTGGIVKTLLSDGPDNGEYTWYGSKDIKAGRYYIKITSLGDTTDGYDYSDSLFNIVLY